MDLNESFWGNSLEEIKKGFSYDPNKKTYFCLICGLVFHEGEIYKIEERFFDAETATELHIKNEHSSTFEFLLSLDKKYTGFTDHQKQLLMYFYNGYSDKEITEKLGGSTSTIRNYRFTFKEKEKQAKIILAVMELLRENSNNQEKFIDIHRGATMIDERYAITEEEYNKVLKAYFKEGLDGSLSNFPKKEKRKIIILMHLLKRFDKEKKYSEKEVNAIIGAAYDDYVTIRRYFIEYGFMDRNNDGSAYWIKN